ncbi:hypothetical protein [Candidatus Phytoplasma pruni]|uniref:Uncharacterized protein n=1 Tax=Candidatus Phytoplasma pruni TaxID=479893 RepID=A0A851HHZ5_9MOLU|nr:hypothetical protein [Candidatus Phytoplasma pruni]NWN45924.1 hypothetical protein [Candidatus Phytoplasma pruni]
MTDGLWDEEYYLYNKNTRLDNKTAEEQLMEALLKALEESGQLDEFLYYVKKFGLKAALEHLSELFPQVLQRLEKSGFLPLLELVLNKLYSLETLEKLGNALIDMLQKLGRTAQAEELKRLLKEGVLTKEDKEETFAQVLEEALGRKGPRPKGEPRWPNANTRKDKGTPYSDKKKLKILLKNNSKNY